MEKVLALKEMMKKHAPKRENLDPRNWMKNEQVKKVYDLIFNKEPEEDTDNSFDHKEMLLQTEKLFIEAAKSNDIAAMKILGRGLNANAKNAHNRTALHYAVAGKNKEAVELLLRRRVQVDQRDKFGVAPIHLAAWFGSLEILKLLVRAGAEQKVENEEGLNILHCAAINNHTEIVDYIVNDLQMKELDKDDESGHCAFAMAAEHGCVQMLEMLMEPCYNMDTMKPNKKGDTPLHLAAKNGHLDTVQLLLQCFDIRDEVNTEGETALYQAAENAQEHCVLALLKDDCDPNIQTTTKYCALHPASERGDASLVRLLLEYNANTDFQNEDLETPLHLAVKNSHLPIIRFLLEAGCDFQITNKRSQTVIHLAAELAKIDVVEMLLKTEIDLTVVDWQGKTVLGVAARADEVIIVDMIIKAERYRAWKTAHPDWNESIHSENPLTFKLDHRNETKHIRSIIWRLAYELLKPRDWKRLAEHLGFTLEQVSAIETQWTGQHSYREHGNRMLLIWFHGAEFAVESPMIELYKALFHTGYGTVADKIRMGSDNFSSRSCSVS
ncbi:ankyrin repeat and death domain-containing protein 1A [Corythoichthys intestinalis]|uniref:ankyrin repeat and death domain-containing protein 1A n=1 Tax=Corythoichthys intestinalis TaxID=161448 RepID=UPI0025A516C0|nr:ankyrin repeat and death domain-containing protein 1A [Corythoichthys intestinalis]XP_061803746.1 ankyrin repeat and death domain-containing protein 1A-like [Nerophis lumbriciformis]